MLVVVLGGLSARSFRQLQAAWARNSSFSSTHFKARLRRRQLFSFSVGMQVNVTATNTLIRLVAVMVVFKTFRPLAAIGAASSAMRR